MGVEGVVWGVRGWFEVTISLQTFFGRVLWGLKTEGVV